MSSFSSALRLMMTGGPLASTHLSMSFNSMLMPSIKIGVEPLSWMREVKCLITLLKGSYSPSSGAINFSLTEAIYVSY